MEKRPRTLGKIESKLLSVLSAQDKTIFTVEDAQKTMGSSSAATLLLLSDLARKRWLIRLTRGKYLIVPLSAGEEAEHSENWYVIAKNLIEPLSYYISYYSALEIHEMTIQPIFTVYISTPNRRRPKEVLGATHRFVYTQASDMEWGLEDVWITPSQKVRVSDLERTIIDCLDRPDLCGGVSEIAKGIWAKRNDIDYQKLVQYVKRLNRKSVAKRLGFLLEIYSLGKEALPELKDLVSPSYALLDPTLEDTGRHISFWKIRVNIERKELMQITST
ncbi:MAG: type IV toxin-antitoxin system AbiEi family antitoxin [Actinomycetota bacterium]|nr:type IV toxin-antitoxin system AbiEi family antitoxin [Actinomycetota bacterium]